MEYEEIEKILKSLDLSQLESIAGVAEKLAIISSEKLTGEVSFSFNFYQGGITNIRVHRSEEMHIPKKRRLRSKGI